MTRNLFQAWKYHSLAGRCRTQATSTAIAAVYLRLGDSAKSSPASLLIYGEPKAWLSIQLPSDVDFESMLHNISNKDPDYQSLEREALECPSCTASSRVLLRVALLTVTQS